MLSETVDGEGRTFTFDPKLFWETKRIPAVARHRNRFAQVLRRARRESPILARMLNDRMKEARRRALDRLFIGDQLAPIEWSVRHDPERWG